MKIKVLAAFRDINNFNIEHTPGEVFDCEPESRAEKIVGLGYAEYVKTEEEKPAPEKPEKVEEQAAPLAETEEPKDEAQAKPETPAEKVEPTPAKRGRKPNNVD